MAGFFKKLADRFKPNVMERLQQSAEAKKKLREGLTLDKAHTINGPVAIATETYRPTGGNLVRPQVTIHTATPTSTGWEVFTNRKEVVWRMWHTDNNTTACTTYNDPWQQWHNCGTTGATDTIWATWNTGMAVTINQSWANWANEADDRFQTRKMSKAERLRREEEERRWRAEEAVRHARYEAEAKERETKRKAADERAMGLLISMLTREQQADLKTHKHFFVKAPSGRLYRIDQGSHGNVKVIDPTSRRVLERLCIQPDGVPAGDSMLMQKLLIETAEVALRMHANITLEDGKVIYGDSSPLTGDKLAKIIPLRRAA